jgi:CRISPR/Cas system-associated protein Cas5 (RAMP superfamily)
MTETRVKNLDFAVCDSVCPHYFGFLSQRPKDSVIPDGCLTCEKILECMVLKPEDTVAETEIKPELSAIESKKDLAEEFGEENKREKPEEGEVKHYEADKSTKRGSNNDFNVESPGMLYAHWSGTVLIRKETLYSWGKVKKVDVETKRGKIMTCKVYPVEDLETGVIQVPDRIQLKLGVKKGSVVKVKPAANP